MANIVIECPVCEKPVMASTGIFAKKKIKCTCGYTIDVNAEKMATKKCSHCGNEVVYERRKSDSAKCPVCHAKINSATETVKITCPGCKCELTTDKNASTYTCPQCKAVIDVQARIEQEKNSGKTSVIRWDMGQNDIFVYRHPVENFNIGSQLIVSEGQKAIFFRNGKGLDQFGPGRHTLETQKLPLLEEVLKFPTDADLTFDSKVYFVKTNRLNVKWGVPEIRLKNPEMDFYVDLGMSGSFDMQLIEDNESARKLVYMIMGTSSGSELSQAIGGGESYTATYISEKFSDIVSSRLADMMANIVIDNHINILDIDRKKIVIAEIFRKDFNVIFEEYGFVIPQNHFSVNRIMIHNTDEVERWRKQEADRVLKVRDENVLKAEAEARQGRILVEEQTEAQRKILRTQGEGEALKIFATAQGEATKISAAAEAEATKLSAQGEAEAILLTGQASAASYSAQAMAEAEEMRAKGYTYAQETSRQIGLEAMQNGLPGTGGGGNGSASGLGDTIGSMMGLGVGLGAMGGVVNMTKDMLQPMMNTVAQVGKEEEKVTPLNTNKTTAWNCSCGKNCITSKFCPECGSAKPIEHNLDMWTCACGCQNITSRFCPDCGAPKPVSSTLWNCPNCGLKDITSKFCPECGTKKEG